VLVYRSIRKVGPLFKQKASGLRWQGNEERSLQSNQSTVCSPLDTQTGLAAEVLVLLAMSACNPELEAIEDNRSIPFRMPAPYSAQA
jgi:hypothetical protein